MVGGGGVGTTCKAVSEPAVQGAPGEDGTDALTQRKEFVSWWGRVEARRP